GIQQYCMDVGEWSAYLGGDVQNMKAVQIWFIGQTVERASIRCRNEDIVIPCIGQVGAEAAEGRFRNAFSRIRWIERWSDARYADISCKAGLVERIPGDHAFANERNPGGNRRHRGRHHCKCRNSTNKSKKGDSTTQGKYHEDSPY